MSDNSSVHASAVLVGERAVLIRGPSGAGKSVLTRTIIGLVPKVSGRIEVFGVDLDEIGRAHV